MHPEILYEDNHILAVNKPPGMLVQRDKSEDDCILDVMKALIKRRDSKPGQVFMGLPHRLDRPSSGVLILAKTSKALSRITEAFRNGNTSKIYWAVVENPLHAPQGDLVDWLCKNEKTNTSRRVAPHSPKAKKAHLSYRLLSTVQQYQLVEVTLLTGRHHQIRIQLASIGSPIKNDGKYGAKQTDFSGHIYLHARQLELPHPVKDATITVVAPLPDDPLWRFFFEQEADKRIVEGLS